MGVEVTEERISVHTVEEIGASLRAGTSVRIDLDGGYLDIDRPLPILVVRQLSERAQDVMLGFAAGVMLLNPALSQETEEGFVVDEIVAKVDNYIVLKSEVDRMYQDYLTNGNSPSQQARCEILSLITRNKLMLAKAEIVWLNMSSRSR